MRQDPLHRDPLHEAHKWAERRHTRIVSFGVCRVGEKGPRVEAEFPSLEEARDVARRCLHDTRGRGLTIWALTPEGWARQIEDVRDPG